jgi:hypothetical protein
MKVPRMSRVERRQLIRLGRRSDDPYTALRFQAVARLGTRSSARQVAAALEIATSTVVGAANRFLADGVAGLYDRRRDNGARKTDERFDRVLVRLLGRTPQDFGWQRPTWTRELLCLQMKLEGFPAVAVCTMGRALSRIGARLGTPKPIVLCPWPRDRRLRVLAAIRRLEARASAEEPVLYSDEVDIHLNPKIGRDWMLRGHQRRIVTPGKNQKFYLAGARRAYRALTHHRRRQQERRALLPVALAARQPLPTRALCAPHRRQLWHPQGPAHARDPRRLRWPHRPALPAALLPRFQPHRARLAGLPRQCHPQPPLQDLEPPPRQRPPVPRRLPMEARGRQTRRLSGCMIPFENHDR